MERISQRRFSPGSGSLLSPRGICRRRIAADIVLLALRLVLVQNQEQNEVPVLAGIRALYKGDTIENPKTRTKRYEAVYIARLHGPRVFGRSVMMSTDATKLTDTSTQDRSENLDTGHVYRPRRNCPFAPRSVIVLLGPDLGNEEREW